MNFRNFEAIYGNAKLSVMTAKAVKNDAGHQALRSEMDFIIAAQEKIMETVMKQFCFFFPVSCEKAEKLPAFDYKFFFKLAKQYPEVFEENREEFEALKADMLKQGREIPRV